MKKYYVIELTTYVDNTPDAKAIYGAYDLTTAGSTFHSKMSGAMKNANYATEMCMVVTEDGLVVSDYTEFWSRANEEETES